jgi:DNA polymerase I-like protein with 3'-5' exonuclease and polymerase domains
VLYLRFDLSQAEDRIVKVLSHDQELIELARKKPWEFDVHRFNGAIVFDKPEFEITKAERQGSKRVVHASNYDAQPERLSDALLDDGFIVTPQECGIAQGRYHKRFPAIRNGYQLRTRMLVIQNRCLEGRDGFKIEFKYERLDGSLFRRAYAWRPQHFIGTHLNQSGIIPCWHYIHDHGFVSRIDFQVHDEIAIAVPNEQEAWDLASLLHETLEEEKEYEGERLSIPADLALETRYHGREQYHELIEFKQFPEQGAFNEAFRELWSRRVA